MNALAVCAVLAIALYTFLYDWVLLFLNLSLLSSYYFLSFHYLPASTRSLNTVWRRMRIAMWPAPVTPEVLGEERIRVGKVLKFCSDLSEKTGKKVSLLHAMIKAFSVASVKVDDLRGKIAFGAFCPFEETNLSFMFPARTGEGIRWITIENADKKSLSVIAEECRNEIAKEEQAPELPSRLPSWVPVPIWSIVLELASLFTVQLGLNLPQLSLKRHPFGCGLLSDFNDLSVEMLWAPFPPFCRLPITISAVKLQKDAIVVDGRVVVEDVLHLCATLDHRFIDGTRGAIVANEVKKVLESPEDYFTI